MPVPRSTFRKKSRRHTPTICEYDQRTKRSDFANRY